ncbi:sodium:alanine symporter [Sporosarcina sp. P37]|uniref:alanine/glycine:cation symporter family protein n=1 Tax=unclassified Sporosarcina TaxID=2647733 RepID=UPI0009C03C85|nr:MULTISPECIES: alanine/glycine:cation symporter family protein [unclassified Sporosarcina]ARD47385.1 sodium:alanine symporter [Sporosarcina sp. P33]ARK23954.1 sodium:alanine symporter [Sporosarcina sp. P37]PID17269.1 alanine:cation symporter family protein [Sporosarcina sp. P35]
MQNIVDWLNGYVWSPVLVIILLCAGIFFTIATRFVQIRHLFEMFRLIFQSKSSDAGISSFQSLALSLGDKIGVGNIAGVATAIAYGGPGAVFWMWIMGFLGVAISFIETTLAQVYKSKQDGQFRGGTPYYIEKALNLKWLAIIFAIFTMITGAFLLPNIQVNTISASMNEAFNISPSVTGIVLAVLLGCIIIGGVKRIARVAELVVPVMAMVYIVLAITMVILNITEFPNVLSLILSSAFGANASFGGIIGSAIAWGVKRGAFSNGAGFGSETYAPAAAEVSHPAKQGLVQALSTYIDTVVVCSMTAFMILVTGMYNVTPENGAAIVNNIGDVEPGAVYTQRAIDTLVPGYGVSFLAIAILFFAFTSIMFYSYMAETGLAYVKRGLNIKWIWPEYALKLGFLISVYIGSVKSASFAWALGDLGYGSMAWINIIVVLFLTKPVLKVLKDYESQKKQGLDPVFDPVKVGIKNADFWEFEYERPSVDLQNKNDQKK